MRRLGIAAAVFLAVGTATGTATAASGWRSSVPFTNQVASSPTNGGGYRAQATGGVVQVD